MPRLLSPSHSSSGGFFLVLIHPTLVSLKNASTAFAAFSFHSHLAEGALGFFHPRAFPISFYSLAIWGRQALHSVNSNRWWRVRFFPPPHHQPRSLSVL